MTTNANTTQLAEEAASALLAEISNLPPGVQRHAARKWVDAHPLMADIVLL